MGGLSPLIQRRGYLRLSELFIIAWWKTDDRFKDSRPYEIVTHNSRKRIEQVTREAFQLLEKKQVNEAIAKLRAPNGLWGIQLPYASAFLCFYDREKYGVIDQYALKALEQLDRRFHFDDANECIYEDYLAALADIRRLIPDFDFHMIDAALYVIRDNPL